MAMIFPGMDPYLEDPALWPGVHNSLIVYIRDRLQPRLRPRYVAVIQERVYVGNPERSVWPDALVRQPRPARPPAAAGGAAVATAEAVEADAPVIVVVPREPIHEPYVAVMAVQGGQKVVTVIEVVSPSNKNAGPGRESYLAKQREMFASDVHLVEIDLLRQGPHTVSVPEPLARQRCSYDYLACVSRAGRRDAYELYPSRLRDRLPRIRIPLAGDDPDVVLDVHAVLEQAYDAGDYRGWLDYSQPCKPPLSADDRAWAEALVRAAAPGGG